MNVITKTKHSDCKNACHSPVVLSYYSRLTIALPMALRGQKKGALPEICSMSCKFYITAVEKNTGSLLQVSCSC